MIYRFKLFVISLSFIGLVACGGNTQPPGPFPAPGGTDIIGNWSGTAQSGATISLNVAQATPSASATFAVGTSQVQMTGTYAGNQLNLSVSDASGTLTLTGTVSGNTMSCTLTFTGPGAAPSTSSFTLTKL